MTRSTRLIATTIAITILSTIALTQAAKSQIRCRRRRSLLAPTGVYASPTGYAMFILRQVAVAAGATVHVDGVLADNPNAGTPAEIGALLIARIFDCRIVVDC